MRTSAMRTRKYDKKVGGMVLPGQKDRFRDAVGRQVEIEKIVNTTVGANINRVYYIIFGKELVKLMQKFRAATLDAEVAILQRKWSARGLSIVTLASIKRALNYREFINYFTLDHSLLDGADVLE